MTTTAALLDMLDGLIARADRALGRADALLAAPCHTGAVQSAAMSDTPTTPDPADPDAPDTDDDA